MKNLLMILSLITVITLNYSCKKNSEDSKDCICTREYEPVCGDDGILYSNQCMAECANVSFSQGVCEIEVNAKVVDQGPIALDGCGWVLQFEVDGTVKDHHVNDFPTAFLQNQLDVKITYKPTLETFSCGLLPLQLPIIELIDIQEL